MNFIEITMIFMPSSAINVHFDVLRVRVVFLLLKHDSFIALLTRLHIRCMDAFARHLAHFIHIEMQEKHNSSKVFFGHRRFCWIDMQNVNLLVCSIYAHPLSSFHISFVLRQWDCLMLAFWQPLTGLIQHIERAQRVCINQVWICRSENI